MVYDEARQRVLLFGGFSGGVYRGDTWEWDGQGWQQRATTGPTARAYPCMAYDPVRNRTVLFGGGNATVAYGDTWEWDGSSWVLRASTGPSARRAASAAYDAGASETVMFGGWGSSTPYLGDTWAWNGDGWQLRAAAGPQARRFHTLSAASALGGIVMFGGDASGAPNDQTWVWNGQAWAQLSTPMAPLGRWGHSAAYDSNRGVMTIFGGFRHPGPIGETWELSSGGWNMRPVHGPAPRDHSAMAFDSARSRFVLFGGYIPGGAQPAETWELLSAQPPQIIGQPVGLAVHAGQQAVFEVEAVGPGPLAYQWRRDGINLVDGGRIAGVLTNTLTVNYVQQSDEGVYDVVVSSGCPAVSMGARLSVPCYANCDGSTISPVLNVADFACFLQRFAAGCP